MRGTSRHILLTGGAGYIGAVLVGMVREVYNHVTVLDSFQASNASSLAALYPDVRVVHGNLQDPTIVDASLEGVTDVIYLAGVSDGRAGRLNPELTKAVNEDAFQTFAFQAKKRGCHRFLFASTFGVYGYEQTAPLTESLPPDPQEPYSQSKLHAERFLEGLDGATFRTLSLRLAMAFGSSPSMRFDFLVNQMIKDALETGEVHVLGGKQIRPQIHVRDAGRYFMRLLDMPLDGISGAPYNAVGLNLSVDQIASAICDALGNGVAVRRKPARPNEHTFILNADRLTSITGVSPIYSIKDAVHELQQAHTV